MSDTPKTDAQAFISFSMRDPGKEVVPADFARDLERKLAEALTNATRQKKDER